VRDWFADELAAMADRFNAIEVVIDNQRVALDRRLADAGYTSEALQSELVYIGRCPLSLGSASNHGNVTSNRGTINRHTLLFTQ